MPSQRFARNYLGRRRLLALTTAAAAGTLVRLSGPRAVQGQAATGEPVRRTLANGLVVIAEERRTADTVGFQLSALAGSRDDGAQHGITVLVSRMLFQGTPRRPSETEIQRAAALVGGTIARGTTAELSNFTAVLPFNEVDTGFDLLSDLVVNPLLDDAALTRQKQVLLQEQMQRRADPATLLSDLFLAAMFSGHPLGTPAVGTPETVMPITGAAIAAERERLWGGSNLVLSVVGRISTDEAFARAERAFGSLAAGRRNDRPDQPPPVVNASAPVRGEVGQQQIQFRLGSPGPSRASTDRYPAQVLNALLSDRMFKEVRSARGLAYQAAHGYTQFRDTGTLFTQAGVEPSNLDAALEVVRAELRRVREQTADASEIADRISQIAGNQILADETNAARAARLASIEVLGDVSTEEFVRRIRAVTPEEVQRVARTYLDPERALLVIVGPRAG